LVEFDPQSVEEPDPADPEAFSKALAENVNALLTNPDRRAAMAAASRTRVEDVFSWQSIARQTLDFYQDLAEE
jgi:glycosyltransferase involved in cell wall biosynthesis